MREQHRYRPSCWDRLEDRIALTHGGPITPALFGTLSRNPQASGPSGRVAAQANAAFDRFTQDYLQAQGAFLSSGAPTASFQGFTTQRVNLLAQDLTRIFARLPGSFAKIKSANQRQSSGNSDTVIQAFLFNRINGSADTSLLKTLNTATGALPSGTSGATATLYTLTTTNAIESARVATTNAVKYITNDTFNNSHK